MFVLTYLLTYLLIRAWFVHDEFASSLLNIINTAFMSQSAVVTVSNAKTTFQQLWTRLNLDVLLDIRSIISDNECIWKWRAFDLHKAVGCVSNAARQQLTLQHCIHHCTLTIRRPNTKRHGCRLQITPSAAVTVAKNISDMFSTAKKNFDQF